MNDFLRRFGLATMAAVVLLLAGPAGAANGIITFSFDDGTRGVYDYGLPHLAELEFPCVLFPRCDMIEMGHVHYLSWDEVIELQDVYGWEVGSHTINHLDLTGLNDTDLEYELGESRRLLEENGAKVSGIAIPYGYYDPRVLRFVSKHYLYSRNSDQDHNLLFDGYSDYQIKMIPVRSDVPLADYKAEIDRAVQDGTWLVLGFHRITVDPPTDPLELTAADMRELAEYALSTDIDVATFEDMIEKEEESLVPNFSFESLDSGWARHWTRSSGSMAEDSGLTVDQDSHGNRRPRRSLRIEGAGQLLYATSGAIPVQHGQSYKIDFFIDQNEYTSGESAFIIWEQEGRPGAMGSRDQVFLKVFPSAFVGTYRTMYKPSSPQVTDIKIVFGVNTGSNLVTYIDSVLMKEHDP